MPEPDLVFVAPEMRRKIGWDGRHERMARQIMEEFSLKMPRDRELIRQLALIRIQQGQAAPVPDFRYDPHERENEREADDA